MAVALSGCARSTAAPEPSVVAAPADAGTATTLVVGSSSTGETVVDGLASSVSARSLMDFYLNGGRSFRAIQLEVDRLTAECMQAAGWEYLVSAEADPGVLTFKELRDFRLQHGYGLSDQVSEPDVQALNDDLGANVEILKGLSDSERRAYLVALQGEESEADGAAAPGSCLGDAEATVYADIPQFDPAYAEVGSLFLETLLSDQDYVRAGQEWSECMRSAGFDFDDVDAPRNSLTEQFAQQVEVTPEFRELEMSVAKTDIECFERHVLAVQAEVEARIVADLVESGRLPELPGQGTQKSE